MDIQSLLNARESLNLFPTENKMSARALTALASDAANRYPLLDLPEIFLGDVMGLEQVRDECVDLAREFFGAKHAFVPFLSGLQTMHSVLSILGHAGCRVLIMSPACGGHYATGPICEQYGYTYAYIPFDRSTLLIDIGALSQAVSEFKPHLIYLDISSAIRLPRSRDIRAAAPDAVICLDASHILGLLPAAPETLVLDGVLNVCSGSTHKTFPGPQKGLLITDDDAVAQTLSTRLPFSVSSTHMGNVGALAITLEELMPHRMRYAEDIMANAKFLASCLAASGFEVSGQEFGFTETHQVWVEMPTELPLSEWGKRLAAANIRSTTVMLPSSGRPGLRLGVQELTRIGMGRDQMGSVSELLSSILLKNSEPTSLRSEVARVVNQFPGVCYAT
ncbi:hypothetical protein [Nocardia sp. NPDC050175]|uniref:hypothetical protein n=1 Tax=Nocardia sp. NPDC050175 TaxID=3364317 RepID=UPI003796DAAA